MDRVLTSAAAAHAVAALAHGVPHYTAGVELALWQWAVVVVTTAGPFVAAALTDRWPRAGTHAFAALLAGSVAFGVAHHWLLGGPDNVENVASPHHAAFEASAVVLAVVGGLGIVVAYSMSATYSSVSSVESSR